MSRLLTIEEALNLPNHVFVDVRSEGEYQDDTLPGAINFPLLNDDERAVVGTLYRHEGQDAATVKGLELVSPKLSALYQRFKELASRHQVVVLCWRGGMRSKSVVDFLEMMGLSVFRLKGGYKAYRHYANKFLENPLPGQRLAVLRGLTGVGKTGIIETLLKIGGGAVDLEGLANHRGSAFGSVGLGDQPTQKTFESRLIKALLANQRRLYLVVECESKRIGKIILPARVHEAMVGGPQILVYDSIENRVKRIVRIYTNGVWDNLPGLKESIGKLAKRLGKARVAHLTELVDKKEFEEVVRILLIEYYDPLYKYPSQPSPGYDLCVDAVDESRAAVAIKEYLEGLT